MKKIAFVCHGNICRSVAAEYIFKDLISKLGITNEFIVISRATSLEEIGNDIYPLMKNELRKHNVSFVRHYATRISYEELSSFDHIYYFDSNNLYNLKRLFPNHVFKNVAPISTNEIEDPWYTGRFSYVYEEIYLSCLNILKSLHINVDSL